MPLTLFPHHRNVQTGEALFHDERLNGAAPGEEQGRPQSSLCLRHRSFLATIYQLSSLEPAWVEVVVGGGRRRHGSATPRGGASHRRAATAGELPEPVLRPIPCARLDLAALLPAPPWDAQRMAGPPPSLRPKPTAFVTISEGLYLPPALSSTLQTWRLLLRFRVSPHHPYRRGERGCVEAFAGALLLSTDAHDGRVAERVCVRGPRRSPTMTAETEEESRRAWGSILEAHTAGQQRFTAAVAAAAGQGRGGGGGGGEQRTWLQGAGSSNCPLLPPLSVGLVRRLQADVGASYLLEFFAGSPTGVLAIHTAAVAAAVPEEESWALYWWRQWRATPHREALTALPPAAIALEAVVQWRIAPRSVLTPRAGLTRGPHGRRVRAASLSLSVKTECTPVKCTRLGVEGDLRGDAAAVAFQEAKRRLLCDGSAAAKVGLATGAVSATSPAVDSTEAHEDGGSEAEGQRLTMPSSLSSETAVHPAEMPRCDGVLGEEWGDNAVCRGGGEGRPARCGSGTPPPTHDHREAESKGRTRRERVCSSLLCVGWRDTCEDRLLLAAWWPLAAAPSSSSSSKEEKREGKEKEKEEEEAAAMESLRALRSYVLPQPLFPCAALHPPPLLLLLRGRGTARRGRGAVCVDDDGDGAALLREARSGKHTVSTFLLPPSEPPLSLHPGGGVVTYRTCSTASFPEKTTTVVCTLLNLAARRSPLREESKAWLARVDLARRRLRSSQPQSTSGHCGVRTSPGTGAEDLSAGRHRLPQLFVWNGALVQRRRRQRQRRLCSLLLAYGACEDGDTAAAAASEGESHRHSLECSASGARASQLSAKQQAVCRRLLEEDADAEAPLSSLFFFQCCTHVESLWEATLHHLLSAAQRDRAAGAPPFIDSRASLKLLLLTAVRREAVLVFYSWFYDLLDANAELASRGSHEDGAATDTAVWASTRQSMRAAPASPAKPVKEEELWCMDSDDTLLRASTGSPLAASAGRMLHYPFRTSSTPFAGAEERRRRGLRTFAAEVLEDASHVLRRHRHCRRVFPYAARCTDGFKGLLAAAERAASDAAVARLQTLRARRTGSHTELGVGSEPSASLSDRAPKVGVRPSPDSRLVASRLWSAHHRGSVKHISGGAPGEDDGDPAAVHTAYVLAAERHEDRLLAQLLALSDLPVALRGPTRR